MNTLVYDFAERTKNETKNIDLTDAYSSNSLKFPMKVPKENWKQWYYKSTYGCEMQEAQGIILKKASNQGIIR